MIQIVQPYCEIKRYRKLYVQKTQILQLLSLKKSEFAIRGTAATMRGDYMLAVKIF